MLKAVEKEYDTAPAAREQAGPISAEPGVSERVETAVVNGGE